MPTIVERFRQRFTPGSDATQLATQKPEWATACLNCGASLSSAYCPDCGQRAVPPHPTVNELAGDAFAEVSGWDGKFIETFRLLLRKPGELTRQFVEGKRVRYIAPVRLYLTLSLVYFVLAASTPILGPLEAGINAGSVKVSITTDNPKGKGVLSAEDRAAAQKQFETSPAFMKPILKRVLDDPEGFRRKLFETMPRVMFVLVPLLGAIVGLFYRKRHYPEHLYFALHLASFVFLIMSVVELSKFTYVFTLSAVLGIIAQLAVPIYGFLALRRVYGGSIGSTIFKEIGIVALYALAYGATMACVLYYAAVAA